MPRLKFYSLLVNCNWNIFWLCSVFLSGLRWGFWMYGSDLLLPILKVFIHAAVAEGVRMRWRWRSVGNSVAPSWASSGRLGSRSRDGKGQDWDWERVTIFTSACSLVHSGSEHGVFGNTGEWNLDRGFWYFITDMISSGKIETFEQQLFGNTKCMGIL